MDNANFWLWTLLFALLFYFICKAYCICYNTRNDDLIYVHLAPSENKNIYSIQSNKIDS